MCQNIKTIWSLSDTPDRENSVASCNSITIVSMYILIELISSGNMYVPILTLICCLIRNYAHYYFCSGQTKISTPEGAVRMEVKKRYSKLEIPLCPQPQNTRANEFFIPV